MTRKAVTIVVCLVAIAASLCYTLWPRERRPPLSAERHGRPWVCEACGHTFVHLLAPGTLRCPSCGEHAAVQSVVYACGKCDGEFEAYRLKDYSAAESATDERGKPVLPVVYGKAPGGTWTTNVAQLTPSRCAECGNADAATLRPKGERR